MFARKYYSHNSFTFELWLYPEIQSNNKTVIFGDDAEDIGIFYENGNIIFQLNSQSIEYTLPSIKKVFHVVAVYSINSMSLFIDGDLVSEKGLNDFEFSNADLDLTSGPTLLPSDSFLINSVAVYRHALAQSSIQYHFNQGQALPAIQIAEPAGGELFELYDDELSCLYKFTYPESKGWEDLVVDGLEYNAYYNCLQLIKTTTATSNTVVVTDFISIPTTAVFDSSKIEWNGDNGITVEVSTNNVNFIPCVNGEQIPNYTIDSFSTTGKIYLKITFESFDTSRYIPRLFDLQILFYNDQTKYSYNGNSYLKTLKPDPNTSTYKITIGRLPYNILSRNYKNGLRTVTDSGFKILTTNSISTVEFFYTPTSLNDSGIVHIDSVGSYSPAAYSWRNSGVISKSNISKIYVNGVDKTAETDVANVFKAEQLHHVIIVFSSPVSGSLKFNYSLYGASSALYQYIALYQYAFTQSQAHNNFHYYINKETLSISDSSVLSTTESGATVYDNDWIVVENI